MLFWRTEINLLIGRLQNSILPCFPVVFFVLSLWSFRPVKKLCFVEKVCEKRIKLKSRVWVCSRDPRRLKIVDYRVFNFAYNYCRFVNDLVFLEGSTRQDFDSHCGFKGKADECSSSSSRLHFGCSRRCEV